MATNLVLGTLRWQLLLDARFRPLLNRPTQALPPEIEIALRLGSFQLLLLDRIPPHAAIGESVELAKRSSAPFAPGMVNAVLRRVAAQPRPAEPLHPANAAALAEATAHPRWLVERWVLLYGLERATSVCRFDQAPAPLAVRLGNAHQAEELAAEGIELAPGEFLTAARRVLKGDVTASRAYRERRVRVQDEGSQLVAELAGHGRRILDACAAPGGKAAILAERNPATEITALDRSRRRLDAMRARFGTRFHYSAADAATQRFHPDFDLVLCDVPCSGTGTLARNPEIRHLLRPEDLPRQQTRQIAILRNALAALEPCGRLLYSTCSLEPEENEAVVEAALAGRAEYALHSLQPELDRLVNEGAMTAAAAGRLRETALVRGMLRILPGMHASDGFFAALVVRS